MSVDVQDLYERYGPMVLRRCRSLLRDDAQSQDAMQDVFVAVLRREHVLHAEAPSALLLRVATNVCLNRLRTRRRRPEETTSARDEQLLRIADQDEPGPRAERVTIARQLLARVFPATERLAVSSRTLAVMHLVDGLTLEEVAHETGLSVSGVRKRLRSLKQRLAEVEAIP